MRINPQLLEKSGSLSSVLPITAIALLLSITIVPLTPGALVAMTPLVTVQLLGRRRELCPDIGHHHPAGGEGTDFHYFKNLAQNTEPSDLLVRRLFF